MGLFDDITRAREILGISLRANTSDIQTRYRALLREWHPDRNPDRQTEAAEKTRKIVLAGKILLDFCRKYEIDFSEANVRPYISLEESWVRRFGADPVWGKGDGND